MKKTFYASALGLVLYGGAIAQEKETLEGNGKLTTRDITVQPFTALKATGVYELRLTQGDKEAVRIEADENLQELFIVHNEGVTLVIDTKKLTKNLKAKNKMRVYVTFRNLKNLELSNVGNVMADDQLSFDDIAVETKSVGNVHLKMSANTFDLDNKGVGTVTLSGKAQTASIKSHGVGNLEAGSFVVQTLSIENSGVGHAEVNAEKNLKVKDNMLGKVRNKGAAPVRKMNKVAI